MTSRDFCFWLQGFFEIEQAHGKAELPVLNTSQVEMIKRHLGLVFLHEIDPSMGSKEKQDKLNQIHDDVESISPFLPIAQFPNIHNGQTLRC